MNPYETAQADPDTYPRKGIDRRTIAYALAAPIMMAFFISLVLGFWILVVSIGRLFTPTGRAVPLPTEAEPQSAMTTPRS